MGFDFRHNIFFPRTSLVVDVYTYTSARVAVYDRRRLVITASVVTTASQTDSVVRTPTRRSRDTHCCYGFLLSWIVIDENDDLCYSRHRRYYYYVLRPSSSGPSRSLWALVSCVTRFVGRRQSYRPRIGRRSRKRRRPRQSGGGREVAKHDVRRGTYTLHVTLPRLLRNTSNNNHNDNVLIVSYRDDNNNYCAPTTLYIVVHVYPHKTPRFDVYHGHGCVSVCM